MKRLTGFDYVNYFFMLLALLAWLLPFIYLIAVSFSSPRAILNKEVILFPVEFNLSAYETIFTYPSFFNNYMNTIVYTLLGTAIAMAMTALFAYPLSKSHLIGHSLVMKFVIFSMVFTGGLIPTYLLISNLKMTGTIWAMVIPHAVNQFNLIILINFFRSLPEELEDAAKIDGLGYFGIFTKIAIPLAKPALATITLYYAVFFWNDWFNGLIYLNTDQYPVMLLLRNIVNGTAVMDAGAGGAEKMTIGISIKAAVIITTTLPIIILYPFLQKYFVQGIMVGAVKG